MTDSLPPPYTEDHNDDTGALLPQHRPSLERRARSWSGTKPKGDRALASFASRPATFLNEEQSPCAPALKEARPPISPKKVRSGFLVPFLRRIDTPDPEKDRKHARLSPLARSISAADLTSPPTTGGETQPTCATRKRQPSTDQKVVRFAFAEDLRPYLGERSCGDGDDVREGSSGISKTPAPTVPYDSPETTPTTPTSTTHRRGRHSLLWEGEGEHPGIGVPYGTAAAAATAAGPSAEGDLLLSTHLVPAGAGKHYEARQAALPQPQALSNFSGGGLPYPSPVSPPDPEYIRQVEATLEASFATDHPQAVEGEEDQQQQFVPPSPAYELDVSQMTDEQVYEKLVGPVGDWFHYPPRQVAEEFVPESKAHWDWPALEIRGRDQFSGLGGPGLSVNDGSGIMWPSTF